MLDYQTIFDQRGNSYNFAHQIAPWARREELNAILSSLRPQAHETIVVTAAGGGFDADGIFSSVRPDLCSVICVEPCKEFASVIPAHLLVRHCPLDCIPIASESVDAVVNLAAMHHSISPLSDIMEWTRLLKPNGRLVIADVQVDTDPGRFLNEAVDRLNPSGHRGNFVIPGQTTAWLRSLNRWRSIEENLKQYHWRFHDTYEMVNFTRNLFGMTLGTDEEILSEIDSYLGVKTGDDELALSFPWSLRFVVAIK